MPAVPGPQAGCAERVKASGPDRSFASDARGDREVREGRLRRSVHMGVRGTNEYDGAACRVFRRQSRTIPFALFLTLAVGRDNAAPW